MYVSIRVDTKDLRGEAKVLRCLKRTTTQLNGYCYWRWLRALAKDVRLLEKKRGSPGSLDMQYPYRLDI